MLCSPYLSFSGNCREAMIFYKSCLGGELTLQTIGETPLAKKLPKKIRNYILHSTLTADNFLLMGSDISPETGLVKGNENAIMLHCKNEKELNTIYRLLSKDGKIKYPPEISFWGVFFGGFTDKYGHNWMLNFNKNI